MDKLGSIGVPKWRQTGRLLIMSFLVSSSASALTLNEYLDQVREQNSSYKGSVEQSEGAKLKSREADLLFTPQLFAEATVGHDGKPGTPQMYDQVKTQTYSLGIAQQFSFGLQTKLYYELGEKDFKNASAAINPSTYWDAMPKLELSMPLWAGGFGRTARATEVATRAQNYAEQFSSEGQARSQLVAAEASYWKLSAWQDVVTIQERALSSAQSIYDYVSKKSKMNLGDKADVIQAKALVEARSLELQIARNEAAEALRSFNKYRQVKSDESVGALQKIDYNNLEEVSVPTARPGDRPDVLAVNAQLAAAKASSQIVKERNRPTLDVFGTYALNGRDEEMSEALSEAGQSDQDTAYVGVRFKVPLNFGATNDAKKGAIQAEKAAELSQRYAQYSQEQDWINLTRSITDSRDNLKLLTRIEDAQKAKLEAERARLRQGRTTTYQVLLFEQDYSQAAVSKVKSAAQILALQAQMKMYQNSTTGER